MVEQIPREIPPTRRRSQEGTGRVEQGVAALSEPDEGFSANERVRLWASLQLDGYPDTGVIERALPDYPQGPAYVVRFDEPEKVGVPFAVLLTDWLFKMPHDADSEANP